MHVYIDGWMYVWMDGRTDRHLLGIFYVKKYPTVRLKNTRNTGNSVKKYPTYARLCARPDGQAGGRTDGRVCVYARERDSCIACAPARECVYLCSAQNSLTFLHFSPPSINGNHSNMQ